jgi:histidyl-tRNA synthetase
MKTDVETVKGFQDILPPESLKKAAIKEVIEKWFRLYGFVPIETPIIEFDDLMKPENVPEEAQDEAISDRFRLQDRGGRNLGLRYEFTFQLARILKQNPTMKLPFKRYQIGEIFRDEPISQKRFRQFTQCDVDIIGDPSSNADSECLAVFSDILNELKIEYEIEVNNRRLLQSIIESVEIDSPKNVMRELDKIEKIGVDEVKSNLKKFASTNQIITLLKILEKPIEFFKENAFAGVEELNELIENCKNYGIKLKLNPYLSRGFSYYTNNIFEIKCLDENKRKITLAGGGRYNKSVGKFIFREVPAVGISFGLERISEFAKIKALSIPKVLLISIYQEKETIKLAKELRKKGVPCSISFEKVGKSLEYANSLKTPFVIFIGKEEVEKKKFKLKDMESGKESMLSDKQLVKTLSK